MTIEHRADCFWHRGGRCTCLSESGETGDPAAELAAEQATRPGSAHYLAAVQPIDLIDACDLGFYEGTIIKYVTRWARKNGLEDLDKAAWYLDRLRERVRRASDVS